MTVSEVTENSVPLCISNTPSELTDFMILIFSLLNGLLKEDTRSKKLLKACHQ